MYDVRLSYLYFVREAYKEHYLFAFLDGPAMKGETTSDFLAFFGFGFSNEDGINVSPIMRDTHMVLLDNTEKDSTQLAKLVDILNVLCDFYHVNDRDLRLALRYFFASRESEQYRFMDSMYPLDKLGIRNINQHEREPLPSTSLGIACGVGRSGNKYFGIEIPKPGNFKFDTIFAPEYEEYNWALSSCVGKGDGVHSLLDKMCTFKFTSYPTLAQQNEYIRKIQDKISHIT